MFKNYDYSSLTDEELRILVNDLEGKYEKLRVQRAYGAAEYYQLSAARGEKTKRERKAELNGLVEQLRMSGVNTVTVEYSGSGDSGWWEEATLDGGDDDVLNEQERHQIADLLMYEYAGSGWEINDGGGGTITLNVADLTVEVDSYINVVQQEHETHTFEL